MQNNLRRFIAPLLSIEQTLSELESESIEVKGIVINDSGTPSILVYNNENLKKFITNRSLVSICIDYSMGNVEDNNNLLYLNGCRLMWSNSLY